MKLKAAPGDGSSYLVSIPAIIFFALLTIAMAYLDYLLLAGIALFLFILTVVARIWGALAMKDVFLDVSADKTALYPGETAEITYGIRNDKLLPLIWMELAQDMPPRRCIVPTEGFEEGTRIVFDGNAPSQKIPVLKKGFSFVMGRSEIKAPTLWRAQCRGQYTPSGLFLRSGDGFGLARTSRDYVSDSVPVMTVFPRHIPVDVSMMMRDQWDCASGRRGYAEDMTVLRGLRPYQDTDSWKRINWRMAARQDEIQVNLYETIQPRCAHFVLDGESFCELSPDFSELEEALEILGSMITDLFAAGVPCGLSLPRSKTLPALNITSDGGAAAERLLSLLAAYDCLAEVDKDRRIVPSCFTAGAAFAARSTSGRTYIVTRSAEDAATRLMPHYDKNKTVILCWETPSEGVADGGFHVRSLQSFRKGEDT